MHRTFPDPSLQDEISVECPPHPACIDQRVSAPDESTPLLSKSNADQSTVESQLSKSPEMIPVPKLQLAIICLVRLLEPIGFTQLFPYINKMVVELNVLDDPSKVGFVSGLVVSTHSMQRLFSNLAHFQPFIRSPALRTT